jgi:ATP-dependent DNA helicase RecG
MNKLGLSHRPSFRQNYLHPSLKAGYIEMTIPENPRSSKQRYRITSLEKEVLNMAKDRDAV